MGLMKELYIEFNWIKKVIKSCNTFDQYKNSKNLIELFNNKHRPEISLTISKNDLTQLVRIHEMTSELYGLISTNTTDWINTQFKDL